MSQKAKQQNSETAKQQNNKRAKEQMGKRANEKLCKKSKRTKKENIAKPIKQMLKNNLTPQKLR